MGECRIDRQRRGQRIFRGLAGIPARLNGASFGQSAKYIYPCDLLDEMDRHVDRYDRITRINWGHDSALRRKC